MVNIIKQCGNCKNWHETMPKSGVGSCSVCAQDWRFADFFCIEPDDFEARIDVQLGEELVKTKIPQLTFIQRFFFKMYRRHMLKKVPIFALRTIYSRQLSAINLVLGYESDSVER